MPAYKDEVRKTYYVSFYYTDWTGKKKKKKKEGFKTLREAKAYERDFLDKAHANPDMTFGSLVSLYMEDCKSRLKPTTYTNKQYLMDTKLLPYFNDTPVNKITPAVVRKWQNELMDHGNNYSPTYLKAVNNQLSAVLNFGVKYYGLHSNPARICGSIGRKDADSIAFWTVEEFNRFLEVVEKPVSKVVFELLFWTGMRSGELMALTLGDFDFEAQTVSISKNYAKHKGSDLILAPKTPKSKRIITMPSFLCDMVQAYASTLYDYQPHERLFVMSRSNLHSEMDRNSKKAGVDRIRIHDLRHSHASLLIEMGFSPLLISERLGHDNIKTTLQTYSHLYPNKHGEVADRLQEMKRMTPENTAETDEK